jgi:hypothetical protein
MIYKKVFGTLVLSIILIGASLATYSFVSANNHSPQTSRYFEGIVKSKSPSSFTLVSSDRDPVEMNIDRNTNFADHIRFADIGEGDHLKVDTNRQGSRFVVITIKKVNDGNGYGYGRNGGRTILINVVIISKDFNHGRMVVNNNGRRMTIRMNPSTMFMGSNFRDIKVGSRCHISGNQGDNDNYDADDVIPTT